ncbi:MAG: triose-phosphate isomerase, partial [Ureaplasma sp.]|nr:triose-phosphate isomerase [Ureaplasma sp.]
MKYIFSNIKTNKTKKELISYFNEIEEWKNNKEVNLKKCVFFINSFYALKMNEMFSEIPIGIQSGCQFGFGSYTSSVAIEQIQSENIKWILLGHSEEFKYFNETIESLSEKVKKAIDCKMNVLLCFGNEIDFNNNQLLANFLLEQLQIILSKVNKEYFKNIILAYEPIAAIGTNNAMNPEVADNIIGLIKQNLELLFNHSFDIVYGGSVNVQNSRNFLEQNNI